MAFVFTLIYITFGLLSPAVLPQAIMALHVNVILGVLVILTLIPKIGQAKLGSVVDSYLVLGLWIATGVSMLATGWISRVPSIFMDMLPILFVYYFVLISCETYKQLRILVYLLLVIAVFIFAQGFIADHTGNIMSPYIEPETTLTGTIFRYRGLGVLNDPNDLAQFFATVVPLLWLRWKKGNVLGNFFVTLIPACILIGGMYFTHSRGGIVGLLAVFLFAFKDKIGVVKSSILAGGLLAAMVALNMSGGRGLNDDDGGRVAAWITGLQIFKTHPLFGVGIGNFWNYNDTGLTAHNSYVLCLAELGLFGYFCWIGTIVSNWTDLSVLVRSKGADDSEKKTDRFGALPVAKRSPPQIKAWGASQAASIPSLKLSANVGVTPQLAAAYQGAGVGGSTTWSPAAIRPGQLAIQDAPPDDETLRHAARIFRITFVGMLTTAFFLSRTFSMVFYIILGMSASLRRIYRISHPDELKAEMGPMVKKIVIVVVASVLFLYVFVRVRGLH